MGRFGRAVSALRTPGVPPGPPRLRPLGEQSLADTEAVAHAEGQLSDPRDRPGKLWTKETAPPRARDRPVGSPPPIPNIGLPETTWPPTWLERMIDWLFDCWDRVRGAGSQGTDGLPSDDRQ
jgi:hypothetical protein